MTLDELLALKEDAELEAKAAQGADGLGEVPKTLWETYSSFANTNGGLIVLGAEELRDGSLRALGLYNPERVKRDLWNTLNNRQKVSVNLLHEADIEVVTEGDRRVLVMRVPRASRRERPVFINGNPLTGTYRRNFEGDYRCSEIVVRRMIADAEEDTRDARILEHFGLEDLDEESLKRYRNLFSAVNPSHPWLTLDDRSLLQMLGGWAKDRATGHEGLTVAGLLMFGKLRSIYDAVPNYLVDYQEHPPETARTRWIDRITTDGTWSGNLFDFYLKVSRKITEDLKVPFRLVESHRRIDETVVHEALREAMVNTLVHADYSGRTGIVIIKRPDGFSFRNPGGLRLSIEEVEEGGRSDCRNRNLQKMFQMLGEGEQAGSGFSKILMAWREQHWRRPLLRENTQLDETLLELPTISLLPASVVEELGELLGPIFTQLDEIERVAIATAHMEGEVSHHRLRELSRAHSRDLTVKLQGLVRRGLLIPEGSGRHMTYRLASPDLPPLFELFSDEKQRVSHEKQQTSYEKRPPLGGSKRANPEEVKAAILAYCADEFRTAKEIADALGRTRSTLLTHYLPGLIHEGLLELRFPAHPRHKLQAYRTHRKP